MNADPPPIPFAAWLRETRDALAEKRPADVPCGACNACCRTHHFIHVRAGERRALRRIPRRFLFPAPAMPPGTMVMGYDEAGRCPMLVDDRCTIYDDRPVTCRTYDCRIYAAVGFEADREDIQRQVERWRFTFAGEDDRRLAAALRAAASRIRDPATSPLDGVRRREPVRVAVLAVAVHERFVERATPARRPVTDRARRLAVLAAEDELFGDV